MKYLAQDLMLLALNDETGAVRSAASTALPYGLVGAVLLDLVLQQKLMLENKKLIVVEPRSIGDEFLDRFLIEVATEPHPKTPQRWINRWHRKHPDLKKTVLQSLVRSEILSQQEQRELWVFRVQRYFLSNPAAKSEIVDRVRSAVLTGANLDARTAALISLIKACKLVNVLFTSEERGEARQRIKAISQGEFVGKAVSDTVKEMQAAIMTTIIAATVTSTASSSSNQ
jgi:golgi phosphoprotein 3